MSMYKQVDLSSTFMFLYSRYLYSTFKSADNRLSQWLSVSCGFVCDEFHWLYGRQLLEIEMKATPILHV